MDKSQLIEKSRLLPRLFKEGSPIVITSCILYFNKEDGKEYLNIKLYNLFDKVIDKVVFTVSCFNGEKGETHEEKGFLEDVNALPYVNFNDDNYIQLENVDTEQIEIQIDEVWYDDNSKWINVLFDKEYISIENLEFAKEILSENEFLNYVNTYDVAVFDNENESKSQIIENEIDSQIVKKRNKVKKVKVEKQKGESILDKLKNMPSKRKMLYCLIAVAVIICSTLAVTLIQAKNVSFVSNSKNIVENEFLIFDKILMEEPLVGTQNGDKILEGWYENDALMGNAITFPHMVEKNTKLYAKWTKGSAGLLYEFENGKAYVVGYNGTSENVVIPETIKGKKVCEIKGDVFKSSQIHSVEISKNIDKIEQSAFSGANIEKIIVAEENLNFATYDNVLYDKALTILHSVPKNRTDSAVKLPENLQEITESAFEGNTFIKELTIPSSVQFVDSYAFSGCTNLESVVFEGKITQIGQGAFKNCKQLKKLVLPTDLRAIPNEMAKGCAFEEITMPTRVERIGESAFEDCINLKIIFLPKGVSRIEPNTFQNCSALASVQNASTITSVGDNAFANCVALASIFQTNQLKEIGNQAFFNCKRLVYFEISPSIKVLGKDVLSGCVGLKEISVPILSKSASTLEYYFGVGEKPTKLKVKINHSDMKILEKKMLQGIDMETLNMVDANFTSISSNAIDGMKNLFDLYLPSSLESMADNSINDCELLSIVFFLSKAPTCGSRPLSIGNHDYFILVPKGTLSDYQRVFKEVSQRLQENPY